MKHKLKRKKPVTQRADFAVVNKAFDEYLKGLSDDRVPEDEVQELLDEYGHINNGQEIVDDRDHEKRCRSLG